MQQVTHPRGAPEANADDSISDEYDHPLRTNHGIGAADRELWSETKGYVTLVPDEALPPSRAEHVDELGTPMPTSGPTRR